MFMDLIQPMREREREFVAGVENIQLFFFGLWCVAGDFNLTRFVSERKGLRSHEKDLRHCQRI